MKAKQKEEGADPPATNKWLAKSRQAAQEVQSTINTKYERALSFKKKALKANSFIMPSHKVAGMMEAQLFMPNAQVHVDIVIKERRKKFQDISEGQDVETEQEAMAKRRKYRKLVDNLAGMLRTQIVQNGGAFLAALSSSMYPGGEDDLEGEEGDEKAAEKRALDPGMMDKIKGLASSYQELVDEFEAIKARYMQVSAESAVVGAESHMLAMASQQHALKLEGIAGDMLSTIHSALAQEAQDRQEAARAKAAALAAAAEAADAVAAAAAAVPADDEDDGATESEPPTPSAPAPAPTNPLPTTLTVGEKAKLAAHVLKSLNPEHIMSYCERVIHTAQNLRPGPQKKDRKPKAAKIDAEKLRIGSLHQGQAPREKTLPTGLRQHTNAGSALRPARTRTELFSLQALASQSGAADAELSAVRSHSSIRMVSQFKAGSMTQAGVHLSRIYSTHSIVAKKSSTSRGVMHAPPLDLGFQEEFADVSQDLPIAMLNDFHEGQDEGSTPASPAALPAPGAPQPDPPLPEQEWEQEQDPEPEQVQEQVQARKQPSASAPAPAPVVLRRPRQPPRASKLQQPALQPHMHAAKLPGGEVLFDGPNTSRFLAPMPGGQGVLNQSGRIAAGRPGAGQRGPARPKNPRLAALDGMAQRVDTGPATVGPWGGEEAGPGSSKTLASTWHGGDKGFWGSSQQTLSPVRGGPKASPFAPEAFGVGGQTVLQATLGRGQVQQPPGRVQQPPGQVYFGQGEAVGHPQGRFVEAPLGQATQGAAGGGYQQAQGFDEGGAQGYNLGSTWDATQGSASDQGGMGPRDYEGPGYQSQSNAGLHAHPATLGSDGTAQGTASTHEPLKPLRSPRSPRSQQQRRSTRSPPPPPRSPRSSQNQPPLSPRSLQPPRQVSLQFHQQQGGSAHSPQHRPQHAQEQRSAPYTSQPIPALFQQAQHPQHARDQQAPYAVQPGPGGHSQHAQHVQEQQPSPYNSQQVPAPLQHARDQQAPHAVHPGPGHSQHTQHTQHVHEHPFAYPAQHGAGPPQQAQHMGQSSRLAAGQAGLPAGPSPRSRTQRQGEDHPTPPHPHFQQTDGRTPSAQDDALFAQQARRGRSALGPPAGAPRQDSDRPQHQGAMHPAASQQAQTRGGYPQAQHEADRTPSHHSQHPQHQQQMHYTSQATFQPAPSQAGPPQPHSQAPHSQGASYAAYSAAQTYGVSPHPHHAADTAAVRDRQTEVTWHPRHEQGAPNTYPGGPHPAGGWEDYDQQPEKKSSSILPKVHHGLPHNNNDHGPLGSFSDGESVPKLPALTALQGQQSLSSTMSSSGSLGSTGSRLGGSSWTGDVAARQERLSQQLGLHKSKGPVSRAGRALKGVHRHRTAPHVIPSGSGGFPELAQVAHGHRLSQHH